MTIMEEVDDEMFDLQFVEAKRKSIIVRSDSSPGGFLSKDSDSPTTDGAPIPPKEGFSTDADLLINRPFKIPF